MNNLLTKTDRKEQTISYGYDVLGIRLADAERALLRN
jgi:hypothetical protein